MTPLRCSCRASPLFIFLCLLAFSGLAPTRVCGQAAAVISGTVSDATDGSPIGGASVSLLGTGFRAVTRQDGAFSISRIPAGAHVLRVVLLGYRTEERSLVVHEGQERRMDIRLHTEPIQLSALVVQGVSRVTETLMEAPASVTVLSEAARNSAAMAGQAPVAFVSTPGLDLVQNGIHDFNVNSRGFNASLSRSTLVLQDGRDLSVPFLGSQEWASLSQPMDDFDRVEVIRGPGSALYGANAFTGLISMTTPEARDVEGTKVSLSAGELNTVRADIRHAGLAADGRIGYRVNGGYSRSGSWARSRTRLDGADFAREYSTATDAPVSPPLPGFELVPLHGQTRDPSTGRAEGDPEDLESLSGSGRIDYYRTDGSVFTLDGGVSQVRNGLFMTAIGRVQVLEAVRPWARVAWESEDHKLSAWYSGRVAQDPQMLLSAALPIDDHSSVFQAEGQTRRRFLDGRGSFVIGGSVKEGKVDTKGTLMAPENDARSDSYRSVFGQVEYALTPRIQIIAAGRVDESDLFSRRFSPKAGLVFTPSSRHALRITANRAFLTPSQVEFFLQISPSTEDLSTLEGGLRLSPLGPALAGVPPGGLFTESAAVPVMAQGNPDLEPETVTSYEAGYKGQIGDRLFATVDAYFSRVSNFVTTLLPAPAVNTAFAPWTAPGAVPEAYRGPLEDAVREALAGTPGEFGLTRLDGGQTVIAMSYGNAGLVHEWGVELAANFWMSNRMNLAATYTFFDFDIKKALEGDVLLPNTPKHKGTVSVEFTGRTGFDFGIHGRFVAAYEWASGVFMGRIPASQTVDLTASYEVSRTLRLNALATNLFDQRRFHIYGGSVNGRRVLVGFSLAR